MKERNLAIIMCLVIILSSSTMVVAQCNSTRLVTFIMEEGTHVHIPDGWIYSWFDYDHDEIIDLDEEVETVVYNISDGYMTTNYYPRGEDVCQYVYSPGHYPSSMKYTVPNNWYEPDTSFYLGQVDLKRITSDLDVSIFTASISNNSETTIDFHMRILDSDSAFGVGNWFDLGTNTHYTNPMLSIAIKQGDRYNVFFKHYDNFFSGCLYGYYFWELEPFFNDIDDPIDRWQTLSIHLEVFGAFELYITVADMFQYPLYENGFIELPSVPTFIYNGTENCYNTTRPKIYFEPEFSMKQYEGNKDWCFRFIEEDNENDDNTFDLKIIAFSTIIFVSCCIVSYYITWKYLKKEHADRIEIRESIENGKKQKAKTTHSGST